MTLVSIAALILQWAVFPEKPVKCLNDNLHVF